MEPLDPVAELMRLAKEFRAKYWRERGDEKRDCAALSAAISQALADARRLALEEAAKMVEDMTNETRWDVAVAIRTLVDGKAGGT